MSVQLRFEIEAGWADVRITIEGEEVAVTASYLSDGLGDLAGAVVTVLRGPGSAMVVFAEEPGEYRWTLTRTDADRLLLQIVATPGLASDPKHGDTAVLNAVTRLRTFAGQVRAEFQRLRAEYGEAGYEERWGHRFPAERITEIEALLAPGGPAASPT